MMILLKKSVASFNERIYMFFETRDQMVFMIMPHDGQVIICVYIYIYLYMDMIWFQIKGDVT